ncbi:MAG TPA: hypothetical protein VN610_00265 [Bryobacteraceae bacterium]|nr:hypothetical protein [Bryobacteraceae bacterium]
MEAVRFRNFWKQAMIAGVFVAFSVAAGAQDWHRGGYERGSVIDQVQQDLDRAQSRAASRHDAKRIDHARHELWDFERKSSQGRFDKGELDEAIGALQSVVDHNAMPYGERSRLQDDANRLRDFRASRGYGYGYRGR